MPRTSTHASPFSAFTTVYGTRPVPGGWNRLHLQVADLAGEVDRLHAAGCSFRSDIISGPGGSQILLEDPSGNVVELFQPAR